MLLTKASREKLGASDAPTGAIILMGDGDSEEREDSNDGDRSANAASLAAAIAAVAVAPSPGEFEPESESCKPKRRRGERHPDLLVLLAVVGDMDHDEVLSRVADLRSLPTKDSTLPPPALTRPRPPAAAAFLSRGSGDEPVGEAAERSPATRGADAFDGEIFACFSVALEYAGIGTRFALFLAANSSRDKRAGVGCVDFVEPPRPSSCRRISSVRAFRDNSTMLPCMLAADSMSATPRSWPAFVSRPRLGLEKAAEQDFDTRGSGNW